MTTFPHLYTVQPEGVTKVSEETVTEEKTVKPKPTPRRMPKVKKLVVHPGVWSKAKQLCKGNPKRLEIKSETVVIVHNSENWNK